MTEAQAELPWPELGAKSPEKPQKPRSAPREKKSDNRNKDRKDREAAPREKDAPDNGEPLVKPTKVEEPNHEKQEEHDNRLRAEIDADERKVTDLNEQIEKAREERGEFNEGMKAVRSGLNELRAKSREVAAERDALVEHLKKHSEQTRNMEVKLQRIRKELKLLDQAAIDKEIQDMTNRLETSSLDLKTEKQIVFEIKKLSGQKEQLKEYEQEKALVQAKKDEHDQIYEKRKEIGERLNKMRDEEKEIVAKLEAMRSGEGTADGVAPNVKVAELQEQKQKLIDGMKAKRAAIKESNVQFRIKMAEFREYQRALQAYEYKVQRREYAARRAEQAEKNAAYKEQKKQRDQERKEEKVRQEQRFAAVAAGFQMFVGGLAIRTTDEDLRQLFKQYGEVTDCVVVTDNETNLSRGFGFVTMTTKEATDEAIKQCANKEFKTLCPPHGRLSVKLAAKSKQQQEWETKQKRAAENKDNAEAKSGEPKAEGEGKAKGEGKRRKGKGQDAEAGKEEEKEEVDADAADDFLSAFGASGGEAGKVELPAKAAAASAAPAPAEAAEASAEGGKKDWKPTRTDWVKDAETNGVNGHANGVAEGEAVEPTPN